MNRTDSAVAATLVAILAIPGALGGCRQSGHNSGAASASASASARPEPVAIPIDPKVVAKAVNPEKRKPYAGPTGAIAGTVTIKGDPPPTRPEVLKVIPAACDRAPDTYGRLFRVDDQKHLADALVTVTGYTGFIPASSDAVKVLGRGCAWSSRTIAVTFGQKLAVRSRGRQSYVPELRGGTMASQMVAIPGGSAVTLYPEAVGHYELMDSMHTFMRAEVLVLKYATFDVTGRDGRYEIKGIPAGGEVTVTAFLPQAMLHVDRKVKVEPGKTTHVDLELTYKKLALPASSGKPGSKPPVIR